MGAKRPGNTITVNPETPEMDALAQSAPAILLVPSPIPTKTRQTYSKDSIQKDLSTIPPPAPQSITRVHAANVFPRKWRNNTMYSHSRKHVWWMSIQDFCTNYSNLRCLHHWIIIWSDQCHSLLPCKLPVHHMHDLVCFVYMPQMLWWSTVLNLCSPWWSNPAACSLPNPQFQPILLDEVVIVIIVKNALCCSSGTTKEAWTAWKHEFPNWFCIFWAHESKH